MKKEFNPADWIETPNIEMKESKKMINKSSISNGNNTEQIEKIIQEIESRKIDIAPNYKDWRNIGFAFSDEFGESGRNYFHQVSMFHQEYDFKSCNEQYSNCLKALGNGISIKSFFYLAKHAGIDIVNSRETKEKSTKDLPNFPNSLYDQLPDFLRRVTDEFKSDKDKEMMLLSSIVTLSSSLPKLWGIYDRKRVYPNLFLFITGQASSGKGSLVHSKQLVHPIHKAFREESKNLKQKYENEMKDYHALKKKGKEVDKPLAPPDKMLFLPANNSSTGMFQLLSDNEGKGLIFETEGDTLANAFKSDYGNYSDGFRKAFHHEAITYYRRTNREYVEIEDPRLSAVLSGTPKQISTLIPNSENGLFSRFIFYIFEVKMIWKDVFENKGNNGLGNYFKQLADEYYDFYRILKSNPKLEFCLTQQQEDQFNNIFESMQDKFVKLKGLDYVGTVRRLGLVTFRFAMILSSIRIMENGEISEHIECNDTDFQTAVTMVKVLVEHSAKVFSELEGESQPNRLKNRKQNFIDNLPDTFNRKKYLEVAANLSINPKTAEGYITSFVNSGMIHRDSQDHYININVQDTTSI